MNKLLWDLSALSLQAVYVMLKEVPEETLNQDLLLNCTSVLGSFLL